MVGVDLEAPTEKVMAPMLNRECQRHDFLFIHRPLSWSALSREDNLAIIFHESHVLAREAQESSHLFCFTRNWPIQNSLYFRRIHVNSPSRNDVFQILNRGQAKETLLMVSNKLMMV